MISNMTSNLEQFDAVIIATSAIMGVSASVSNGGFNNLKVPNSQLPVGQPKFTATEVTIQEFNATNCLYKHEMKELTLEDKIILKRTWSFLSNDLLGNGSKIVLKLFEDSDDTRAVLNCDTITDGEALPCNRNFKTQALRIMQVIDASIVNIDDLDDKMGPVLIELGRIHFRYQAFLPKYWNLVPEAILHVWSEELGEHTREAWTNLLHFMVTKLKAGYHQACVEDSIARLDEVVIPSNIVQ